MGPALGRVLVTPRSLTRAPGRMLHPLIEAGFELVFCTPGETPGEAELLQLLPGCVGWIAGVEPVSERVLRAAAGLRAISRNGTGVDNLPLTVAAGLGISILRAPAANATGVAELAICLMLASIRSVPTLSAALRSGAWRRQLGGEIGGRTVGVVGCGAIGQRVVRAALGLGACVVAYDPFPASSFRPEGPFGWQDLDTLLAQSDVVSLHCPMPAGDQPLLDALMIARMPPGCHLINTARAGLIDEDALLAALDDGRIGGYATDVFAIEPPPPSRLIAHERVIATPHIGGFTAESVSAATNAAIDNLLQALASA